jgi:hypothetical protein
MRPAEFGCITHLSGEILASWFIANPNGPTAYAVGFVELKQSRRLFYRWMHFTGGQVWLSADINNEMEAAGGDFGEVLVNAVLGFHNHFMAAGDKGVVAGIPSIVVPNGNRGVEAAFKELIKLMCEKENWGREIYYLRKYGNNFFARCGEEFLDIYEALKRDPNASPDFLEAVWLFYQHQMGFKEWQPGRYASSTLREEIFDEWWRTITRHEFIHEGALARFCQMWIGAEAQSGLVQELKDRGRYCPLSETLMFYQNFNQPLLPPGIDEEFIRTGMRP